MSRDTMKIRYGYDKLSNWGIQQKDYDTTSQSRVNVRGKEATGYASPLLRIRQDKLRSLKRAIYNSYQSAVIVFDKDDRQFHFRCLINHDKLKVDYEDKVLSIPYRQIPVEYQGDSSLDLADKIVDTGTPGALTDGDGNVILDDDGNETIGYRVKAGDTFKWISGNQGYMPNSYWIIFLQYSEETAYFRGEIRKADDEIEVIPIDEDGEQGDPVIYHGWTTGPNEDQAIWNVKHGVVWNDLYYTKILYITKDETTTAFFDRFNRVVINGQTWEVQGYNGNYGTTSSSSQGGMIRVALKETYTSTNEVLQNLADAEAAAATEIFGPTTIQSYDIVKYYVPQSSDSSYSWTISDNAPVKVLSEEDSVLKIQVSQVTETTTMSISYGDQVVQITVEPFK